MDAVKETPQVGTAGPETKLNGNGATKVCEYWPQRQVSTVREETLNRWREDLELKALQIRTELEKIEGGIVQIDLELARREEERKERRKQCGGIPAK